MNNKFFDKVFITEEVKKRIELSKIFIETNDLLLIEKGRHNIEGDNLYVNIAIFETAQEKDRIWEAHRKYIDLHYIIEGEEEIQINDIQNMEVRTYIEEEDFVPAEGRAKIIVHMYQGDLCLCYPHEVHKTGVRINSARQIKKAIFKIKID